jgi:hypothetical protein
VAKSLSAADMLGRTRREDRPIEMQATSPSVTLVPSRSIDEASSRQVDKSTSDLGSERYQKISAFVTPDQRGWLKSTLKELPVEGLSGSDIVRLALERLRADVAGGLALLDELTNQAHAELERFSGRRNRGLPPAVRD